MTASPALPLASLEAVSVNQGGVPILADIQFELFPGEAWLLTGPNGGGKSTLLGLLRGDLSPSSGTRRYFLDGAWRTSAVRALRAFALVSPAQEAWFLTRDWAQTVQDVLLAGIEGDMLRLWEADADALARVSEVARLTGVGGWLEQDFRTLSHGQRRRVLLARALMSRPKALLLDEFTDGLSVEARAELRGVLEAVAGEGVALLLATHRPEEAPALNWNYLQISGGTVRQEAPPSAAIRAASGLVAYTAARGPVPALVTLEHATVYRNGHLALGPISWQWRQGQHWLVTGDNGAGKSTLARLIAGELFPSLGGLVIRHFLRRDLLSERRRSIGVVGAELAIRQRREWSGFSVIASGYSGSEGFAPTLTPAQTVRVHELAARLDVTDLLTRSADTLSQGQLKRLLLARAVLHSPTLLLLDEPLDFLDAGAQAAVLALLDDVRATGTHLLVIAHRAEDAPPGLTDHLQLEQGRVRDAVLGQEL
ncbi:ATP-binding cassette domain-containing protein [Deinococcus sp. KNUC1210]|uniref:ATP-binding cassette domain-containing protein n=1 Tax=Deinococcus sp. KNUC1210 TaxID=2917691 RepID=UPI001EEF88A3|nr:ATP-binding cassette domain-containing protein [Deinococcus sp. KNUC1210]ULH15621.1 ATP-binding cassette domain-containing protein [Deinococcus sp. KNUC1210]